MQIIDTMLHRAHPEEEDEIGIVEEYIGDYASISSIVREALPFEIIVTMGGVIAGILLSGMTAELQLIPGLIVI